MSASNIVYRKTAAGLAEMQARRLRLPRKTFSLLLAVDGQRSREQLCTSLSAFGDVAAQLEMLEEMGLIEDGDTRASGAFSFASPLQKRREEGAGARFDTGLPGHPGPAGTGVPSFGAGSGHDGLPAAGALAPTAPSELAADDADPVQGTGPRPPPDPDFDSGSTVTWAVTDAGPTTTTLSPLTLTGMPSGAGGFVELDTWPGTEVRGEVAPTWPKSSSEAPADPAAGSAAGLPAEATPTTGPQPIAPLPTLSDLPDLPTLPAGRSALVPLEPQPEGVGPGDRSAPPAAAVQQAPAGTSLGPIPAAQAVGPAHPGRLPPLAASLQDARRPAAVPGGFKAEGSAGLPGAAAPTTIHVPTVTPLPPWSMPVPPPQAVTAQPQYPAPFDRSRTYPAEFNLIDIRAYIGIGSQRVDPLANVREAMAHVLARNIDLQNYELLHAIESMQSRDELMRLLPYYLVDLDRRLAPADYSLHVEDLSRLSGLSTDALLALMTQRKAGETPV